MTTTTPPRPVPTPAPARGCPPHPTGLPCTGPTPGRSHPTHAATVGPVTYRWTGRYAR